VGVNFGNSQCQKREWEQLEHILGGGAVCHGRELGVLLCGSFGVGGGLDRTDGSLN
jgi:hypothetical protein